MSESFSPNNITTYGNFTILDNQQESPLYTAKYDYNAQGENKRMMIKKHTYNKKKYI